MDPLRLLSRSTKLNQHARKQSDQPNPSNGQIVTPQLYPGESTDPGSRSSNLGKRKRGAGRIYGKEINGEDLAVNFFSQKSDPDLVSKRKKTVNTDTNPLPRRSDSHDDSSPDDGAEADFVSIETRKHVLAQHKLKISWLNPPPVSKKAARKTREAGKSKRKDKVSLYPRPLEKFGGLTARQNISRSLATSLEDQGYTLPTEVQLAALPLLLDGFSHLLTADGESPDAATDDDIDLLTVAPTGSGKTLAFLIPLLHSIGRRKANHTDEGRRISGIILAPTKELVAQLVNEGRKLTGKSKIKIAQVRKGMRLAQGDGDLASENSSQDATVVKADILVATPGILQSLIEDTSSATRALAAVRHLVLDEADVLLDPLFREQTLTIWNALSNPTLRVSLWSATMGSNIEELARSTIEGRRQRLSTELGGNVHEGRLVRLVVGLKDSAVPNVDHKLIYAATEQGKLMGLRQLIHPTTSTSEAGPPMRPPFLIFTQTIERAIALHSELLYDIPVEAGGISRIAVLHSNLSDAARDRIMTRFRRGEIWVLITTDLLSRGVDFRGINGIVNYDLPASSAAYVHRVGRTGRAGRQGGVAVTFYSTEDVPYLKHVANVVAMAQKGQKGGEAAMQQWLLDALPKLSKNEKKNLKKHGVESRTARGREKDPKASRSSRISTKAGYVRREENRRKGAIQGSQRRQEAAEAAESDDGEETDFGGFD